MDFFPVDDSMLSAPAIARFVKEKYVLPDPVTAKIIKTGINHTYLVTHGAGKCIFRVYSLHWRSQKEIAEEIKLLLLLKENGIPVSFPLADAQSVYIQQLQAPEGLRYAVLFSFAEGGKMLIFPAALHYHAGQIMGRMHAVTHHLVAERGSLYPR